MERKKTCNNDGDDDYGAYDDGDDYGADDGDGDDDDADGNLN